MSRFLLKPTALILLATNLVPVIGVVAWQWDAFVLLMLYWLETAVIAFWTILGIATLPPAALEELQISSATTRKAKPTSSAVGLATFFTLHSGIFMGVHFLFLWELFSGDWAGKIHGVGDFVDLMVLDTGLWLPLLTLFFGRGALMLFDRVELFLRRKLRLASRRREPLVAHGQGETLIFGLYIRIFVMQVTIILGAWLALLAGNAGALVFLIATKTAVDLTFQVMAERFHSAWVQANGLNQQ